VTNSLAKQSNNAYLDELKSKLHCLPLNIIIRYLKFGDCNWA